MVERLLVQTSKNGLFVLDSNSGTTLGQFKKASGYFCGVSFFGSSPCTSHITPPTQLLAITDIAQPFLHFCCVDGLESPLGSYTVPEKLSSITFTPCGSFCVGGGLSGTLYLWYIATGQLIKTWRAHYRPVTCLAISLNGMYLFTTSEDSTVCCFTMDEVMSCCNDTGHFDLKEPQRLHRWIAHSLAVVSLALCDVSYSQTVVITGSLDRHVQVHRVHSDTPLMSYRFPCAVRHVATNPILLEAYVCVDDARIYIVDLGTVCVDGNNEGLKEISYSVSTSDKCFLKHEKQVVSCACNSDGSSLVSCSDDGIRVWDVYSRQVIRHFPFLAEGVCAVQTFIHNDPCTLPRRCSLENRSTDLLFPYLPLTQPLRKNNISTYPDLIFLSTYDINDLQQEMLITLNLWRDSKNLDTKLSNGEILLGDFSNMISDVTFILSLNELKRHVINLQEDKKDMTNILQDVFLTLCELQDPSCNQSKVKEEKESVEDPFTWLQRLVSQFSIETFKQTKQENKDWLSQYNYVDRSFTFKHQSSFNSPISSDSNSNALWKKDMGETPQILQNEAKEVSTCAVKNKAQRSLSLILGSVSDSSAKKKSIKTKEHIPPLRSKYHSQRYCDTFAENDQLNAVFTDKKHSLGSDSVGASGSKRRMRIIGCRRLHRIRHLTRKVSFVRR